MDVKSTGGFNLACTILPFFCFIIMQMNLVACVADEAFLGADLSLSSCVVHLSRGPCRDEVCSRALIHFSPVTDFVKDGNRTTQISVKSIVTQNFLWNGYSPEPVEVNRWNCPGGVWKTDILIMIYWFMRFLSIEYFCMSWALCILCYSYLTLFFYAFFCFFPTAFVMWLFKTCRKPTAHTCICDRVWSWSLISVNSEGCALSLLLLLHWSSYYHIWWQVLQSLIQLIRKLYMHLKLH